MPRANTQSREEDGDELSCAVVGELTDGKKTKACTRFRETFVEENNEAADIVHCALTGYMPDNSKEDGCTRLAELWRDTRAQGEMSPSMTRAMCEVKDEKNSDTCYAEFSGQAINVPFGDKRRTYDLEDWLSVLRSRDAKLSDFAFLSLFSEEAQDALLRELREDDRARNMRAVEEMEEGSDEKASELAAAKIQAAAANKFWGGKARADKTHWQACYDACTYIHGSTEERDRCIYHCKEANRYSRCSKRARKLSKAISEGKDEKKKISNFAYCSSWKQMLETLNNLELA